MTANLGTTWLSNIYLTLNQTAVSLEVFWGTRPRCVLALANGSDEHWQFFHPDHPEMPVYVMDTGTLQVELHPDAPEGPARLW